MAIIQPGTTTTVAASWWPLIPDAAEPEQLRKLLEGAPEESKEAKEA